MANYDTEVLADTPQIYWKLQDTSGTSAADTSGNARPGSYTGTVTTHYALNQAVSLLPADSTLKSVAMYRNGTFTVAKADIIDASSINGRAHVSRNYEAWMNVAGAAFSVECWARVPSTVTRYATAMGQFTLASRRTAYPLQWQMMLAGTGGVSQAVRWEDRLVATNNGQPAYFASNNSKLSASDALIGGGTGTGFEELHPDVTGVEDNYDDKSHHYVMTCGTASLRQYRDGILSEFYITSLVPPIPSNTADALFFGGMNTQTNGLIGYLSHCAHYPSELSAARVAAHYTAGAGRIVLLNQQWALAAAQDLSMSATFNATSSAGFVFGAQMALSPTFSATTNLIPAYRAAMSIAASVNATTLNTPNTVLGVSFMNTASISTSIAASGFAQMTLNNIAGVSAALGLNGIMAMSLADVITAAIVIQAGDVVYNGWILNPNLVASTGLSGFAFNSFVKHKGKYYGIGDGGIYELGGPNDNGANINAFVGLPKMTFGTEKKKSVPYAYIGVSSTEKMVLRVLVGGQVYTYIANRATTEMAEQRIDIGKGLRHTYWQFELTNANGADFELDTIKFMPIVLERRI